MKKRSDSVASSSAVSHSSNISRISNGAVRRTPSRSNQQQQNSQNSQNRKRGESADATPPRENQLLSAKVCIEDLKGVFESYASYGDDGRYDRIDLPRFVYLCRSCDLMDKLFRLRDAEAIFYSVVYQVNRRLASSSTPSSSSSRVAVRQSSDSHNQKMHSPTTTTSSSSSSSSPGLFYHQFRMKVIPEIAAKKQMSILELVKQIVRWGGPRQDKNSRQLAKGIISVGGGKNGLAQEEEEGRTLKSGNSSRAHSPAAAPVNNAATTNGRHSNNNYNNNSSRASSSSAARSKTPTSRRSSSVGVSNNNNNNLTADTRFEDVPDMTPKTYRHNDNDDYE